MVRVLVHLQHHLELRLQYAPTLIVTLHIVPSPSPKFFDTLRHPSTPFDILRHSSTCRTLLRLRSSPGTPRICGIWIPRLSYSLGTVCFSPLVVFSGLPL